MSCRAARGKTRPQRGPGSVACLFHPLICGPPCGLARQCQSQHHRGPGEHSAAHEPVRFGVRRFCETKGIRAHGESHRYRPRDHQLLRRRHGRLDAQGHRECGRRAHHAVDRRVHGRRREACGPAGEASRRHQPRAHLFRDQATDRPHLRRPDDQEGHRPRPLQDRQGQERRRLGRGGRQAALALADLGFHPAEDEGDGGSPSRLRRDAGRHHRPRLFQRRPAPGHQGCRQDRRPRGAAHHQRADGGRARLRARQEGLRHDRGLRPRRRHVRRVDPGDRRRRVRGEVDQRRHVPRRRGLRQPPRRVFRGRVQERERHRPQEGQAGPAAPEGGGREGQDRAVLREPDRHQPALHHRRCVGSQASHAEADPRRSSRRSWTT